MSQPGLERFREMLAFAPLLGIPAMVGLFAVLFVQIQGLHNDNQKLRDEVAAVHAKVVEVRKRVDGVDLKVKAPSLSSQAKRVASDRAARSGGDKKAKSSEKKKRPEGGTASAKRKGPKSEGGGAARARTARPKADGQGKAGNAGKKGKKGKRKGKKQKR